MKLPFEAIPKLRFLTHFSNFLHEEKRRRTGLDEALAMHGA